MTWPADRLHALPDGLSYEVGALLEPLGVALHATDLGKVRAGSRIGIFGCGPIGLLILQVASDAGAEVVVASDPVSHRREAALSYGALSALDPTKPDYESVLGEVCEPDGLDIAFEASNDQRAIQSAVNAARSGGKVVITGIPAGNRISLDASSVRRKGLTLLLTRRMRETYKRAIELVDSGRVDLEGLISHQFPLTEFEEAFRIANDRTGHKVIINP
jgi:L-iditol 2-dehydrogenase